jgi:hypothetical protein
MKTIILFIATVLIGSSCYAAVVIYNSKDKSVYSISDQDDAVMPDSGYTKVTIKETRRDLDMAYPSNCYKWNGRRPVADNNKINAIATEEEAQRVREEKEKIIQDKIRELAIIEIQKKDPNFKEE